MTDVYLRIDLQEAESTGQVPRREWDLIEFYKKVKETKEILGIEINEDGHVLSFIVRPKA